MKTTLWSSFSTLQGFNSAGSTSRKGFHRFMLTRLVEPSSSNNISSGVSPLFWKWPRVKYLYPRSEWTLGFQLKPQRIRVAPLLATSCNRSGLPFHVLLKWLKYTISSSRPFSVRRSTVADGTVDRQTRDGRPLVSTGRQLRLQEVTKNGATRILWGLSWKPRVHSLLEYKYFTLGHFHKEESRHLRYHWKKRVLQALWWKICESPF